MSTAKGWPCFQSPTHLAEWRQLAGPQLPPCTDCTPAYRDRMAELGRCRHPGTRFEAVHGELVGRVPGYEAARPFSAFLVVLGCRVLGVPAVTALVGISSPSLPHYRNGNRILPDTKLATLQRAIRAAALLVAQGPT